MIDLLQRIHWHTSKAWEHPRIHSWLRALSRESTMSALEWRAEQRAKLRQLLRHARDTVPYYRKVFDQVGFDPNEGALHDGLARMPLLTRDILRHRGKELMSARSGRARLLPNATGGSTGRPVNFFQDTNYRTISTAIVTHARQWWGIRPHDRMAIVWGADREVSDLSARDRFYQWRSRTRMLDAFRFDDEAVAEFLRMLKTWCPPFLFGYASALAALAERVSDEKLGGHRFQAICSSAETLFPSQRERIEHAFESPVYNFYGSREVSNLAAECPEQRRLHAISSWRYLEIVNDDGKPVPDGEAGHIVVTDLSNYSMPFIRYQNGDAGCIDPDPCGCGRVTPVLSEILGRTSDLIRTPSGHLVHGEFFTHLFYEREDILQFQVHQTAIDRLVLRYVSGAADRALDESIVRRIQERMGRSVTIDVEACEQIPVPRSGKRRFTISDVRGSGTSTAVGEH